MEQEKKKGGGCLVKLIVGLAVLALVGYGLIMPGKELPVISLAAELIPVSLPIPGFEHGVPNTLPTAIFTSLFLMLIALLYNRAVKKAERTGVESRFLIAMDTIYEGVFSFVATTVGKEKATLFFPLIGSFFFFILFSNWSGLLPGMGSIGIKAVHHGHEELIPLFRSPTADLSTTVGLAIITQVVAQYYGFKFQGKKYLKKFFNFSADPDSGWLKPVLSFANGFAGILELMGEFIKVLSFGFRLFGNVFAGEVLLMVISFLTAFVVVDVFMALELFVGAIQALIFSILSLIFYQMATQHH
ncbi:MAG TPA: ATP synthase F0 subunit A [Chloroflexi bacterium]|nr:MAG: ATP synthase F0 subunit A [Chloroflexota bacterium]HDD56356.1 ATP synthase F0 subunit A [Chloroflexota bacterium]